MNAGLDELLSLEASQPETFVRLRRQMIADLLQQTSGDRCGLEALQSSLDVARVTAASPQRAAGQMLQGITERVEALNYWAARLETELQALQAEPGECRSSEIKRGGIQ